MSKHTKTTKSGNTTVSKTYNDGRLERIQHSRGGKTHEHKVGRNIFGPTTGKRIK